MRGRRAAEGMMQYKDDDVEEAEAEKGQGQEAGQESS